MPRVRETPKNIERVTHEWEYIPPGGSGCILGATSMPEVPVTDLADFIKSFNRAGLDYKVHKISTWFQIVVPVQKYTLVLRFDIAGRFVSRRVIQKGE